MAVLHWQHTHPGWNLWLRWLIGTTGGVVLLLLASIPLNAFDLYAGEQAQAGGIGRFAVVLVISLGWLLTGGCFGLGQWWAARGEIKGFGWWILATLAGYPAGSLLQQVLPGIRVPGWGGLWGGLSMLLSFGLALGVSQWLVLRGRVPRAGWWIVISIAGWLLANTLTNAAYLSGLYVEPLDLVTAFLIPTMVSGAGIVWLLQQRAEGLAARQP